MIVKRLQDKLKAAAHMRLPVLAWPGVVVAVMTGRLGVGRTTARRRRG